MKLSHRPVLQQDFEEICRFPQHEEELFFMFPKASYPLTPKQLEVAVNSRKDSTVVLKNDIIAGFANFYEVKENSYCSIGNVVVNPHFRQQGIGEFLINTMESIAIKKYNITELHLSCFNTNVKGILLYTKLGFIPFEIEKSTDKDNNPIALIKMKKQVKL